MAQTILELQLKGVKEAQADMQRLSEEIVKQKQRQAELKKEMKATEKAFKDGEISQEDYTKAMAQNNIEQTKSKKIVSENTAQLKQNIRVVNAQEGSLDQLRASLNLLQKEYGQLDKSTESGRKKAAELTEQIERLDLAVKAEEKSIGDSRRNVGNYADAFSQAGGPIGNFTDRVRGLGTQLKALVATPVGAFIAVLASIVGATKAFMDYNREVQKTNALIMGITNLTGDVVDSIRVQTSAISEVLNVGQEELLQGAKVLVQQFGITYEEALDKMQTGILATNGANDELLQSISEYSVFFADAGFSVEEFTNIVNAGFDLGIYTDKLPDALKEADISLREQTKATTEALTNAFGEEFTSDILNQINIGALSTKDALALLSTEAEKVGLTAEQAATLTADVFRGAGEDAGGALKIFEAINVSLEEQTAQLDEQGLRLKEEIKRQEEVAVARDKAMNSESVQRFMKAFDDLTAFLQKSFFVVIEKFAILVDTSIIQPIEFVIRQFNRLRSASLDAASSLRTFTSFIGLTKAETDKATASNNRFIESVLRSKAATQDAEKAASGLGAAFADNLLENLNESTEATDELTESTAEYAEETFDAAEAVRELARAEQDRRRENIANAKKEFNDRVKEIKNGARLELLERETQQLQILRNFVGTEEERAQLVERFEAENLELRKKAIQDQIDFLEEVAGRELGQASALGIISPELIKQSEDALVLLRNQFEKLNQTTAKTGENPETGEVETIPEKLGLDQEAVETAMMALDALSDAVGTAQQAIGAAETARLKAVDKQVEQGVITQEQAELQKERISKKAARQQQNVSIIQAIINVAQGITKAFATLGPLAPLFAATIAAQGAVQIATIKAQKFAKGGVLNGPSHAQGGIPMFSKGGAFYGEAEGGEAVLTKGVMANPALASMASAINVAGGGVPFFANGGVLDPIQSATPTDRAADIISAGLKSRQPVLVVEQLRERENSVDVIESLRTIG